MGVQGLFSYLQREKIPGAIKALTKKDIVSEIKDLKSSGKDPKIAINLWAFCRYFEEKPLECIFAGRLNKIREEFEGFLSTLKNAGAQLIFFFKKTPIKYEHEWINKRNIDYSCSMKFLELLEGKSTSELYDHLMKVWNRTHPLNIIFSVVLCQVAAKYGEFRGNDLLLMKGIAEHVDIANSEGVYAIIGLDTYYLCYEGPWKFWAARSFKFEEYNKQVILDYHGFTCEKMQLFALLAGKLKTSLGNRDIISSFFKTNSKERFDNFKNMFSYINTLQAPLNRSSFEKIVEDVFGKLEPSIVCDFERSMESFKELEQTSERSMESFNELEEEDKKRFPDQAIIDLVVNVPISLAERILHQRVLTISSTYIDISPSDMMPLNYLILPVTKKTMGLLLKYVDGVSTRTFMTPMDETLWEKILIEPEYPECEVPALKNLVVGDYPNDMKIKLFLFLIDNIVDEEIVKKVPVVFLIHFVILVHLVQNDSMKPFEACAMMQSMLDVEDNTIPRTFIHPQTVNVRAFRLSHLFSTVYYHLVSCMNGVGLTQFVADIKVDNAHFQNLFDKFEQNEAEELGDLGMSDRLMRILQDKLLSD